MTRVLIVDDEPDIVESLQVMLSTKGYEVLSSSAGDEGLAKARAERPDVVLLDVMMPGMNGFDVCRQLKGSVETRHIPVLLITALNQTEDKLKGLEAGADDCITKPFNDSELRARVAAFARTKALRDELEANYVKLKELEQMRDALSGMIVHDLKAPLTAITGGLGVIMDHVGKDAGTPDPIKKLMANALAGSKRLVGLIQDILDVSRMEEAKLPLKKEKVDAGDLVRSCVQALEPMARQAEITLTALPAAVPVELDVSLLDRVLTNLVSNSIKFTEAGGHVKLGARVVEAQVEFFVEDDGIGIPKEHVDKIFEKFFQSGGHEVSRKGQGLGLAFCRMVVESHGGRIWAESEQGRGSRFVVRLPG